MKPQKVKASDPMPDQNDPAVIAQRRKAIETIQQRSGAASTMLSDGYSKDKLGGL